MPFSQPRHRTQQAAYNRQLQDRFAATRRVPPAIPSPAPRDPVARLTELAALHRSGALTDAEFDDGSSMALRP